MFTQDEIKKMNENKLRTEVLIPIFRAMGFRDVYDYHGGSQELGKDIVMWKVGNVGNRENYAVVVKAKRITGKAAKDIPEVKTQIEQCFGSSYKDPVDGSDQRIHICYVVSSHDIGKEAIEALTATLRPSGLNRSTNFIHGNLLWDLIGEYLVEKTFKDSVNKIEKILDSASPYYNLSFKTSGRLREIGVTEKYPGALRDHPVKFSWKIKLDNSPEGVKIQKGLEELYKKGTPIEVKTPYIEGFELPDFITQIIGPLGEVSKLRLEPIPSKEPLTVRIEVIPTNGESSVLEYVQFIRKRIGNEEVLLTNEDQNIPIKLNLIANRLTKTVNIHFSGNLDNLNVRQILDCLRLQNALSKGGEIYISDVANSLKPLKLPIKEGQVESPSEYLIMLMEDLVFIQNETHCQIRFNSKEITDEELNTVAKVMHILTTGWLDGTWDLLAIELYKGGIEYLLMKIRNTSDQSIPITLDREMNEMIFGTEIPLGRVRIQPEQAVLENNIEELESFLKTANEKDTLQLRFKPYKSNRAEMIYLDWQPGNSEKSVQESSKSNPPSPL